MKRKKTFVILFILILITGYFAGVYFFSTHTYPNTMINGVHTPFKNIQEVFESSRYEDIVIEDKDNNQYVLNPKKLGFKSQWEKQIVIEQDEFRWPLQLFKSHNYDNNLIREVDKDKLNKWIYSSDLIKKQVNPKDAQLSLTNGLYEIVPEEEGSKLDVEKLSKTIEDAYLSFENNVKLEDEYIKPAVYVDDLKTKQEALNKLASKDIVLVLQDETEKPIDDYEKFVDDKTFELSKDKVRDYVLELKKEYDNIRSERDFRTYDGNEIKVSGGNFGIQINRDKTIDALYNALSGNGDNKVPIVYTSKAINNGNIGNTYIEISLINQRMVFFKDGEILVDTPVVTGLPNGRYNTPKGVWEVWIKNRDRYLQGTNMDGSKYKSWVNYWMQIDYTGVGIHDSSWQSAYGGNRY